MPWPRGLSVNGRAASGLGAGATCPCRAGDLLQTSTVKRRIRVRMEGYRSPRNPKLATGHEEQVSLAAARRGMDWTCASASASQGFQLLKIRARWSQCLPTAEDSKAPLPLRHLFRKKQIRFFQASHAARTRKCSIQPFRPLDAEQCIFQSPHHSRGTFVSMQLVADRDQQICFHGNRVLAYLRLLKRSFRERPEIGFDGLVLKLLRIRV